MTTTQDQTQVIAKIVRDAQLSNAAHRETPELVVARALVDAGYALRDDVLEECAVYADTKVMNAQIGRLDWLGGKSLARVFREWKSS